MPKPLAEVGSQSGIVVGLQPRSPPVGQIRMQPTGGPPPQVSIAHSAPSWQVPSIELQSAHVNTSHVLSLRQHGRTTLSLHLKLSVLLFFSMKPKVPCPAL